MLSSNNLRRHAPLLRNEIVFSVPHQKFIARLEQGEWDLRVPLNQPAAIEHLRSRGVPPEVAEQFVKARRYRVIHGFDCAPGRRPLFRRKGNLVLNSYVPSEVCPRSGKFPLLEGLLSSATGGGYAEQAWLLNWMAWKVQHPESRSQTAPVFIGAPGIGKTKLGEVLRLILGKNNTAALAPPDLRSKFNGAFATKLLVVANEVFGADIGPGFEAQLKTYITEPDVLVNDKYLRAHHRPNRMSWWLTSNKRLPFRLDGADRRYTIIENWNPPSPQQRQLLEAFHDTNGGWSRGARRQIAAFADHLSSRPVDLLAAKTPLMNAARATLIDWSKITEQLRYPTARPGTSTWGANSGIQ